MYSKILSDLRLLVTGLLCISTLSCSLRLGEDPPPVLPLVLEESSMACTTNIFSHAELFFKGTAEDSNISEFWNCTRDALGVFQDRTKGAHEGVYQAQELKRFLETYFFDDRGIPQGLFDELMQFKVAVMGGVKETLTKGDLVRLADFTRTAEKEMIRFLPYMPIDFDKIQNLDQAGLDKLIATIDFSATEISATIENAKGEYSFKNLEKIAYELTEYFSSAKDTETIASALYQAFAKFQTYTPLVVEARNFLTGRNDSTIHPKDWGVFLKDSSFLFGLYLRVQYWQTRFPRSYHSSGFEYFKLILDDVKHFQNGVLKRYKSETIPLDRFDSLVKAVHAAGLLPEPLKLKSVIDTMSPLMGKLLGGLPEDIEGPEKNAFTRKSFDNIWIALDEWVSSQELINSVFDEELNRKMESGASGSNATVSSISDIAIERAALLKAIASQNKIKLETKDYWLDELRSQRPFFQNNESLIVIPNLESEKNLTYSHHFLSQLNWMHALGRRFIKGYSTAQSSHGDRRGLTMREFQSLYRDLTPIGVDLNVIFPGNTDEDFENQTDSGSKRFREANLFTSRANGGRIASVAEGVEYIAYTFSAKSQAKLVFKDMVARCGSHKKEDIFGKISDAVDFDCFQREFYLRFTEPRNYNPGFSKTLPALIEYYSGISQDDRARFSTLVEGAVRYYDPVDLAYQLPDVEGYLMAIQYVETAYLKFDHDGSGGLNYRESMDAFSVFYVSLEEIVDKEAGGLIRRLEKITGGAISKYTLLELIYTYMLRYGHPPSLESRATAALQLGSWWWSYDKNVKEIHADRMIMLSIMGTLARATSAELKHMNVIPAPPDVDIVLPSGRLRQMLSR